jgi:hypothetical protein
MVEGKPIGFVVKTIFFFNRPVGAGRVRVAFCLNAASAEIAAQFIFH